MRVSTMGVAAIALVAAAVASALWLTRDAPTPVAQAEGAPAGAALRACSRRVLADWYDDGQVGKVYPLGCYRQAITNIPPDFSNVRGDIQRSLDAARVGKLAAPTPGVSAQRAAERTYREWNAALKRGVAEQPKRMFKNPPFAVLRQRLRDAARKYDFKIERLYARWPRQQAPYIIVRTSNPARFAHDLRSFIRQLDPKQNTGDDRTGWAYEGFYLQALDDTTGVPFLAVFNNWRGNHPGGGQWATNPKLLTFDHL